MMLIAPVLTMVVTTKDERDTINTSHSFLQQALSLPVATSSSQ